MTSLKKTIDGNTLEFSTHAEFAEVHAFLRTLIQGWLAAMAGHDADLQNFTARLSLKADALLEAVEGASDVESHT